MAAKGGVLRQVNVGGIVGVGDAARTVPRRIGHIGMAGVIARGNVAAADAVRVPFCRQQDYSVVRRGFRLFLLRGFPFLFRRRFLFFRRFFLLFLRRFFLLVRGFFLFFRRFFLLVRRFFLFFLFRRFFFLLRLVLQRLLFLCFRLLRIFIQCAVVQLRAVRAADRAVGSSCLLRAGCFADARGRLFCAVFGKRRNRQKRKQHRQQQKPTEQSFLHVCPILSVQPSRTPRERRFQRSVAVGRSPTAREYSLAVGRSPTAREYSLAILIFLWSAALQCRRAKTRSASPARGTAPASPVRRSYGYPALPRTGSPVPFPPSGRCTPADSW